MKTYFKTLFLCLLSSYCFAQLTVRNSAYIFASDIDIYVEDDVKLEESTSRFYLRDEAQLLQGAGTTGNSGVGELSVYQEGTVNNYAYNYWASPVGDINANTTSNRDFIAGDILNETTGLITSSPATIIPTDDGEASPLKISKRWLYAFNPGVAYSEWDFLGDGAPLATGYGFTMKGSIGSTNQRYDFAGKPNSGNIAVNVLAEQFTLVGNPYPSALDVYDFIHDSDNSSDMLGTLLFWEHDPTVNSHYLTDYVGGYASYTITDDGMGGFIENYIPATFATLGEDGFPASGAGTSTNPAKFIRRYLPIAQGFMIEGATGIIGTQTVIFKNSHREYYKESDSESQFFRTNNSNSNSTSNQNPQTTLNEIVYNADGFQILPVSQVLRRFRLNVDFNDEITRQLLHNFVPIATDGFDYGLECNNSAPNLNDAYFIDDTTMPYVAQAHEYNIDLKIPLVVTLEENMPLRVRIYDVQNFNNEPIYLHDKTTNLFYDLNQLDFNINLPAGTYTDRFEITFTSDDNTLTTDEFTESSFSVIQNNTMSQLVIANPEFLEIKSVVLIDVTGKQIFNKLNLSKTSRYEFSTRNLSDGMYVATITLNSGYTMSKKVIIANK